MKYIFEKAKHEDYGEWGLKLKGLDFAEPLGAMTAIHDVMEHFPDWKGDELAGELMALGASFFVREYYHQNKGRNNTEVAENMESELYFIWRYYDRTGDSFPNWFSYRPAVSKKLPEYAEEQIRKGARLMVNADEWKELSDNPMADDQDREMARLNIIYWFRKGYRKAQQRYKGFDSYTLSVTFEKLENEVEHEFKQMEEGSTLEITFMNSSPAKFRVRVTHPWDNEEYLN
jgi:hypothetical protein